MAARRLQIHEEIADVVDVGGHMPVDDPERAMRRRLHDLQMVLFDHQGDEIQALRQAIESLSKSHEIIGQMLKPTAELIGARER